MRGSSITPASGMPAQRSLLATSTARPGCCANAASACIRQATEAASSAAPGSSSSVSGQPEASAAASHTLRFEPVDS